jgi:hypothetical protein
MNSRTRNIYSLAAILLAGCVAGERRTAHIEKSWPAGQIRHVEVREVDGTINVHAGTTDKIVLVADVVSRGFRPDPRKDNQGYFRTDIDGDTLMIGRRSSHSFRFPIFHVDEAMISYDLTVPANVELDLHTVNGKIATAGITGETNATTVNGVIDLESEGTSEVSAKSVNGYISAHFLKDFRGATLKTVNGRVVAVLPNDASFYGDFSQVNGDFEAKFPLNIHSTPGSRRVSGQVNGGKYELRITTVNGDIKIDNGAAIPPQPPMVVPSVAPPPPPPPLPRT